MNLILVKLFAMALALGQVTTRPEAIKIEFDPVNDQAEVADILHAGCAHMRKAFDVEDINLDVNSLKITQSKNGFTLRVAYEDRAPYIADIYLLVAFDKQVEIRR